MDDLRYPVGRFERPGRLSDAQRRELIAQVAATPARLRAVVEDLNEGQLDTPYRPGGWTVRQLAHHVPDSHLNAYTRFKLALTESEPTIKPYDEARWAELPDTRSVPVETSLALLDALHERWDAVLRGMQPADFERRLVHPENGPMDLDALLALYAWHGRHHVAHVSALRERMGWNAAEAPASA
ncbi:MAG TPA: putative metal-dependent hydrolase [Longimicrobiaceae bacterium]|jgi:uncharacterized damage-inducible protein DinB|nr:putative metal-dependent hydrolase [Longimicrobiaceae bacterium]